MSSKTICTLPWSHIFISSNGAFYPCAASQTPDGLITDSEKKMILAEGANDFLTAWNSSTIRNIRSQMKNGIRPKSCSYCFAQEDSGQFSYRESMNLKNPILYQQILSENLNEYPAFKLVSLDFRGSNLCNLKCRMCNPSSSQSLQKEWEDYYRKKIDLKSGNLSNESIDFIWKNSSSLESIRLAGGEPFIMPDIKKLLLGLIENDESKHIDLVFHTNLTIIPDIFFEIWRSFKSVHIVASIDGYGELNNYIRFPSNWNQIVSNLRKLFEYSKNEHPIELSVQTTIQNYNIFSISELFHFFKSEFNIVPNLNFLMSPSYLSIQSLPKHLKEKALISILELKNEFSLYTDFEPLKKFLFMQDRSEQFSDFLLWTEFLDQSRKQKLVNILPVFSQVLFK